MTTAHRPTWYNALGGDNQGGNRLVNTTKVSSQDLKGHTVLKVRQTGQSTIEESASKDFKQELEERERKHNAAKKLSNPLESVGEASQFAVDTPLPSLTGTLSLHDSSALIFPEDADDEPAAAQSSDSEVDSDEEELELRRELEKIAKEREEEARKKKAEEDRLHGEARREEVLRGNPLLRSNENGGNWLKRRWNEDVVFKNQAKGVSKPKITFINDTVRSEFHKKFLSKYII